MNKRNQLLFLVTLFFILISFSQQQTIIPKTWDMLALKESHLPPPNSTTKVIYAPEEYYYSLPEHVIYKTFPAYLREFEKPGYLDSLRSLEPEIVFNPTTLKTQEDWIKAGELVFNWPTAFTPYNGKAGRYDTAHFKKSIAKITKAGVYAFNRYVISEKGQLLIGSLSCASCHSRVMPSGELVAGAQGNVFDNIGFARTVESGKPPFIVFEQGEKQLRYTPWAPSDLKDAPSSTKEFADYIRAGIPGVVDRQGAAYQYPLSVPSLIGIKDIKYLDHTGLMKHDGPADMMRYAALNQGMDMLTSYNGYIPGGKNNNTELPASNEWRHPFGYVGKRYSEAQLYALIQYIYSLQPPTHPIKYPKEIVARGSMIFKQAGCVTCHTPPLYTNNLLTPVNGFEPPADHFKKYNIFNVSVETDSVSALYSRRGTGYYKIPSLRGVWYRGAFFHNGQLTKLEEVFDKRRLLPDYVPTGFKPPHLKTMPVKGHTFGLSLSEKDKEALITFLKTL